MAEWKQKRFWKEASVAPAEAGFEVLLDGRKLRTPGKAQLIVPTDAMAQEIAAEWDAQEEKINPLTMPFTRSANSAIDKVIPQFDEVADMLCAYGETDLLCYRAASPQSLRERQSQSWDPLLDWLYETYEARLNTGEGVMYFAQDAKAIARLRAEVAQFNPFELTAFHDLVSLSGSLVIGLAATHKQYAGEKLWKLSRIDEDWQIEQWGDDEEAKEAADIKKNAFLHAVRFFSLTK